MSQTQPADVDDGGDDTRRSRSNTTGSNREKLRPKSRGSTTSLQSVGPGSAFQPSQQMSMDPGAVYRQQPHPAAQMPYEHIPDDLYGYPQHGLPHVHPHQQPIQPAPQQDMRSMSQHGFHDTPQNFPSHYHTGPPPYPIQHQHIQHMRHASEQYEGSPAPDDSGNENAARRKKGNATTLANDQELRRLLHQYAGKKLPEVAAEVQKNEGAGGKSEKAKQVFAMLWLEESCARSTHSVRRDRVFARYTERCANERVPTLNPASFGKLVRIIFPNVQTRRLGVRGESKYHYVDLSLVPDDDDRNYHSIIDDTTTGPGIRSRRNSNAGANETMQIPEALPLEEAPSRRTMETADFPSPSASFLAKDPEAEEEEVPSQPRRPVSPKLDCQHRNTPTIRIPHAGFAYNLVDALPCVRPSLPASMSTYLAMPSLNSLSRAQDSPIELPDIYPYLEGKDYDASIARSLYHLYRSYCIDVIDAFRKCKEKPFFNHHSAYNGKMTVPVSKLFNLECLAPWIQECDMRMYKHLVKFVAPLALQEVPELVSNVLEHISTRLVNHLVMAFEEKCPVHVVVAKVVPAARFANVLKKLKTVNECALQMNRMLEESNARTQMWLDLMVMVDPERLLDESVPPPECYSSILGILKHDMRTLVNPIDGDFTARAEEDPTSTYAKFLNDAPSETSVLPLEILDEPSGLLEKWISWLECLPAAFEGHHPQCMIEWHTKFWRSLMTQIGQGGAHSYQAWWFVEAFSTQLLGWMAEMQGMLMSQEEQKKIDELEQEKKERDAHLAPARPVFKRKRKVDDDDEQQVRQKKPSLSMRPTPILQPTPHSRSNSRPTSTAPATANTESKEPTLPPQPDDEDDAEMKVINRQGPVDLPSFTTGLTSPVKKAAPEAPRLPQHLVHGGEVHDDSGIGLGMDMDPEAAGEARKFNRKDWFMSSDPVDAPGMGAGLGVTA